MTEHFSPTDDETPRQTLERLGASRVRVLLETHGLPQYLLLAAHEWLAEIDRKKETA